MFLHKHIEKTSFRYALFDTEERIAVHPTRYLNALARNERPPESQRQIAYVLKYFCGWLEENFEGVRVDEMLRLVTDVDIIDWVNDQRAAGVSESTIHNREVLTREMFRWLTTAGGGRLIKDLPWGERTFSKSPHSRLPRFVTEEQVITLLRGIHNESQRAAVHFMFDTGVRVSELVRLTNRYLPEERDWPDGANYYILEVPGSKSYDRSKYKFRYTILSRPVLARVRRYQSTHEYMLTKDWGIYNPDKPVFLNVFGEELSIDSVQKCIEAAWARQGRLKNEMSPHRLRHGMAYSVLRGEFGKELLDSLLVVKSSLGHARMKTTEMYTSIPVTALRSLADKQQIRLKHEEAQRIYDATYLPARAHKERRGHSR